MRKLLEMLSLKLGWNFSIYQSRIIGNLPKCQWSPSGTGDFSFVVRFPHVEKGDTT